MRQSSNFNHPIAVWHRQQTHSLQVFSLLLLCLTLTWGITGCGQNRQDNQTSVGFSIQYHPDSTVIDLTYPNDNRLIIRPSRQQVFTIAYSYQDILTTLDELINLNRKVSFKEPYIRLKAFLENHFTHADTLFLPQLDEGIVGYGHQITESLLFQGRAGVYDAAQQRYIPQVILKSYAVESGRSFWSGRDYFLFDSTFLLTGRSFRGTLSDEDGETNLYWRSKPVKPDAYVLP